MDLRDIINVIEDLFYNFVAWIALYPKTMLFTFFRPGKMQQHVTEEWQKPQPERFRSYINPFIFWLLSMILFIWSLSSGESQEAMTFEAFTLTMIVFAILPVIYASLMLTARRIPLSADQLRRPLYIQMLVFGAAQTLLALEFAVSAPLIQMGNDTSNFLKTLLILLAFLVWFAGMAAIFLWIPIAEIRIFMQELSKPWTKVIGWVLLGLLLCGLMMAIMPSISDEIGLVSGMLQFGR